MSDEPIELTEEEKALLATEEPAPAEAETPAEPEASEATTETEPTPEPKSRKVKPKVEPTPAPDVAEESTGDVWDGVNINPEIPAQMTYEQGPWGLLPVQMRHDEDGNPVP